MSFLSDFKNTLNTTFQELQKSQAESLALQISANYIAGKTAAEKHKSIKSAEPEDEEEGQLTTEEKAEIAALIALFLGYLKGFNKITQAQIISEVKWIIKETGNKKELTPESRTAVKQYLKEVFDGKINITIDNVGKTRKEMYVDKDLNISEVTRTVTRAYHTTLNSYASTIAENAAHMAYEGGRKAYYKLQGYDRWVFVGPSDERARPWHVALIGCTFTYGSEQSNYAEHCLHEPRCRHRANVYYGDGRDTPEEEWQKLKDDAGLFWDSESESWQLKKEK